MALGQLTFSHLDREARLFISLYTLRVQTYVLLTIELFVALNYRHIFYNRVISVALNYRHIFNNITSVQGILEDDLFTHLYH